MNWGLVANFIVAIGTLVAAYAAARSARASLSSAKVALYSIDPILRVEIYPRDIGPDKFYAVLTNIGKGVAREIKVSIPAQNRDLGAAIPNLDQGESSSPLKIVEHKTVFYDDPRIEVEYKNIFGDKRKTTATVGVERNRERPQVSMYVDWDVDREAKE